MFAVIFRKCKVLQSETPILDPYGPLQVLVFYGRWALRGNVGESISIFELFPVDEWIEMLRRS